MLKNRRSQVAPVRLTNVLGTLLLCGFFAGAGIGYVWHRNRNQDFEHQIRRKRAQLEDLRMQNSYFARQLEDLRSYRFLETRVKELNLGLTLPQPEQILHLPEPSRATVQQGEIIRVASGGSRP